jgi:hypothetical protein
MRSAGAAIIYCDGLTCGREATGRRTKSGAFYTAHCSSSTGYLAARIGMFAASLMLLMRRVVQF